jgi:hypothetical protein
MSSCNGAHLSTGTTLRLPFKFHEHHEDDLDGWHNKEQFVLVKWYV